MEITFRLIWGKNLLKSTLSQAWCHRILLPKVRKDVVDLWNKGWFLRFLWSKIGIFCLVSKSNLKDLSTEMYNNHFQDIYVTMTNTNKNSANNNLMDNVQLACKFSESSHFHSAPTAQPNTRYEEGTLILLLGSNFDFNPSKFLISTSTLTLSIV